jgi:DNA primase
MSTATRQRWIDFKELRTRLKFPAVLEHYKITVNTKGDQATGFCPLPTHNGEGKSASFSANLTKGIWQCFGCGAKGNVLDFAIRMEGKSPDNRGDVRAVALKLNDLFPSGTEKAKRPTKRSTTSEQLELQSNRPVVINQPLDFELKGLDHEHPYLRDRGFLPNTIKRFDLGFCSRGLMNGRVVIPIHNGQGRLIGYAGRVVDDSKVTDNNPKYRFPSTRERDGVLHEFHKSAVLYNAHRIVEPAPNLIIVEGFPSVWWLYQFGFKDVGALMGWSCSPEQAAIILSKVPTDGRVVVMPDGDDAGKRCAVSVFEQVGAQRDVRWVKLPEGKQPTDYSDTDLFQLLGDV